MSLFGSGLGPASNNFYSDLHIICRGTDSIAMLGRLIGTLVLSLGAGSSTALSQTSSPKAIACSVEASQRYVDSFRKNGPPRERDTISGAVHVTALANDPARY